MIFGFESMHSCSVQLSGVQVFQVFKPQVFGVCFSFSYFALSNLQLLRAFGDLRVAFFVPSGFQAFGVHGFRVFGLWVFVFLMLVLRACKLSGFLPLMFSSFRLSFFDLSPELLIACS